MVTKSKYSKPTTTTIYAGQIMSLCFRQYVRFRKVYDVVNDACYLGFIYTKMMDEIDLLAGFISINSEALLEFCEEAYEVAQATGTLPNILD